MRRSLVRMGVESIVRMSSTRTNYWTELVVDLLLGGVFFYEGWRLQNGGFAIASAFLLGLFAFSFVEYFFHRWMFHTNIPLFAQGHDKHHLNPLGYDSLPFFLPPVILLVMTGLFVLLMPAGFTLIMMGAITYGYIAYGLSHFIIHHVRFKQPLLRRWAGAHHVHHYHPESNFGVTSPLWDVILRTRYVRQARKP